MDERIRFVGRLLEGEEMAALCREFAISRKTGYKIFDRYKESGLEALMDRSRRPWLVSFMDYDLGYIDLEERTLQPLADPFGPKVLPM